jgi:transcriptional regulator with XRE-family HTH domain
MKVRKKMSILRESKGISQAEMAEQLDVDVNTYARIERGETNVLHPKLSKIAELLNVDILDLLADDRNVYLVSESNYNSISSNSCVIGSSAEIGFEIQKLQMAITHKDETISHKDEIIEFQKREIARLEEIIALMKATK